MNTAMKIGKCPQCGSSDVRKLASVYSAGMVGVTSEKGEKFSGASTSAGAVMAAAPPQKMTNWTGWTLSMLLWPPIIWMLLFVAVQQFSGDPTRQEATAGYVSFLTAAIVAIAAWSIPAWRQRRRALAYNHRIWRPAMKHWHDASVCLNCCQVYS